jgi:superfamily II DNA or RNA helicase
LQAGKEKAIITTTIYDDGVDLPDLRTLILAGGGKSTVANLQRIGRGLRKAAGKHEVLVIDFNDKTGAILKRHSTARKKVWKDEGFNIEETS